MARTVNPKVYEEKAKVVASALADAKVTYSFNKDGEQHHKLSVSVPFTNGKEMGKQRNLATKAVRKAFPYRFDFEASNVLPGKKFHNMRWVCYL